MKLIRLDGQKFGSWTVLCLDTENSTSKVKKWSCRCECGNVVSVRSGNLKSGKSTKCSLCANNIERNLTGQTFGEWAVIKKGKKKRGWACKCSCGKKTEVKHYHLTSGASTKCRDCAGTSPKFLTIGEKYNKITVIDHKKERGHVYAICKCDCGKKMKVKTHSLTNNRIKACVNCCNWKGYEEISSSWWSATKRSAFSRGYKFEIEIEDVWEMYISQDRKCILSGMPIYFHRNPSKNYNLQTASLDRIDNEKGYIKENIQLLHKKINYMKHINSQDEFIKMCSFVAENKKP